MPENRGGPETYRGIESKTCEEHVFHNALRRADVGREAPALGALITH